MANEQPNLIWIDCEMTGLDLEKDVLVEIAVLVTDSELNVIGEGIDLVISATPEQLAGMNEFVTQMHTNSGLITEIPSGISVSAAEDLIIKYLESASTVAGKSPLAGNSVSVDRSFIARDMPRLNNYLHYRTIDVSSVKELARRWNAKVYFNSPCQDRQPPRPWRYSRFNRRTRSLPREFPHCWSTTSCKSGSRRRSKLK